MPDTVITQTISTTDAQVLINCGDNPLVSIEVSGTWAGILNIETNLDPDNAVWRAGKVFTEAGATASAAPTANGRWIVQAAGIGQVRARLNPATSGAVVVTLRAGDNETFGIGGTGGGGGGGGPVTAANPGDFVDGWDATQGLKADAGITTDIAGTAMGFRRGNIKLWISYLLRFPAALGGTTSANSLPVVLSSDGPFAVQTGSVTETAPATDTASSGLNGRLQRLAQRLTSLIALLPAALVGGRLDVNVGATVTPANVALDATVTTTNTEIGGLTETAPATDTASSGLNGRAQRIAQRLTSLIALLPSALISNRLDVNLGAAPATVTANATLQAATVAAGNMGGLTKTVNATLTRPANTTTYTANDEMADVATTIRTLSNMATVSGGKGIITHCLLSCSSNGATKPTFTVYIYDTTSTPQTDNAAFAPADGVQDTCIGSFTLSSAEVGDATSNTGNFTMDSGQIHIPYTTVGSADLYCRVKVTNGYTPGANSDTYLFRFKTQQDAN